jgi:hypothetical protein
MKRITITICTAALLLAGKTLLAQAPDSAKMMQNWMDYMTPGKEHKMMAMWDGKWTSQVSMWMAPGAPASTISGTTTNKMILGGRYQQSQHSGSYNGMPFEGFSMLAYDKAKKSFISTWYDNMGSGVMLGEGPWDEASKSITLRGKMVDPSTGKEINFRELFKVIDNDHQTLEMFCAGPDGKEFRTMEVKYTRTK